MNLATYKIILSLFPEKGGGRIGHLMEDYFPNAVFGFDLKDLNTFWNGSYYSYKDTDSESIRNAGIKIKLNINKLYPGGVTIGELRISKEAERYIGNELLKIGSNFLIREGSRIVGIGRVISA